MRNLRLLPAVILALGLTGCGFVIETIAGNVFGRRPESDITQPGFASESITKVVADKVPPTTLVARDGSVCEVPEARFEYIELGQSIVCVWASASLREPIRRPD
jgi:hypothetical protein